MKRNLLAILAVFFISLIPSNANAQEICGEEEMDTLTMCIEEASAPCFEASPLCTADLLNNDISAEVIVNHVTNNCCNKDNKGKKNACFNAALAALKLASKILPPEVKDAVKASLLEYQSAVKLEGACPIDE